MNLMRIPCSIYRGGTSKAILLRGRDLPSESAQRDQLILYLFGSPDLRQINGLGGATPTTSKLGIVELSSRSDADVDFTFGQVSIDKPYVDYKPNCGNVSSAVGPFAVEQGMVKVDKDGQATVRIYNTNSKSICISRFSVKNKHFFPDGDTIISGVPGSGSAIYLDFIEAGGGITGKLFPTDHRINSITLPDKRTFHVTTIDIGNLTVIMDGEELSLQGKEVHEEEIGDALNTMELVRQEVGFQLGLFKRGEPVNPTTFALPKIAFVTTPKDYVTVGKKKILSEDFDVAARVLTMGKLHPSYAVTGGMALTVAAKMEGTVVYKKVAKSVQFKSGFRIGHPTGVLEMTAEIDSFATKVNKITLIRTARLLMDGWALVSNSFGEVVS